MAEFIIVDDSSSAIRYVGAWWGGIDPNDLSNYNHTAHLTRNVGDKLGFTFNGTGIGVFGNYGPDGPQSTYVLDNASPVTFTAPSSTSQVYRQLFYQSPTLQDGEHSLLITFTGPPAAWFWLDYLQHTPSKSAGVTSTSVANAASGTASGGASASRPNKAAISGGVFGGVLLLAIISLGFFLLGRRRRRQGLKIDLLDDGPLEDPPPEITPFTPIRSESAPTMMAVPFGSKPLVTQNPDVHSHRADDSSLSSESGDGIPHLRYELSEVPPVYAKESDVRK